MKFFYFLILFLLLLIPSFVFASSELELEIPLEPEASGSVITDEYISIDFGIPGYPDSETILCQWNSGVCTNLPDSDYTILSIISGGGEWVSMSCLDSGKNLQISDFSLNLLALSASYVDKLIMTQESQIYCNHKLYDPNYIISPFYTTMVQYLPYDIRYHFSRQEAILIYSFAIILFFICFIAFIKLYT